MDLSAIIVTAAVVSILANALKVWEFGSSHIKNLFLTHVEALYRALKYSALH